MSNTPFMTIAPPSPPNWVKHCQETTKENTIYKLFPVEKNTAEFAIISELLDDVQITNIKQVANPILWSRFDNARKDLIKSKSADFNLLRHLELSEDDLRLSHNYLLYSDGKPKFPGAPYNDNMALLFHATRNSKCLDDILQQGLDERLGALSGLLGKGIYFSDNPQKCMQYDNCNTIFIFGVLLGDCLTLPGKPRLNWVREPLKSNEQKRTANDVFFDSIAAQPLDHNEFVIYNRYHCVPMYKVEYVQRSCAVSAIPEVYSKSRKNLPPFGWHSAKMEDARPNESVTEFWPFYAETIFNKMKKASSMSP